MQIEIAPCGAVLCGTVVGATASQQGKAMRGSGTRLIGATLIHDIRPVGPNRYRAKVFVPDRNLHAAGTVHHVAPDRLDVAGCVMIVLCKTAHWRRIGR